MTSFCTVIYEITTTVAARFKNLTFFFFFSSFIMICNLIYSLPFLDFKPKETQICLLGSAPLWAKTVSFGIHLKQTTYHCEGNSEGKMFMS